MDLTEEKNIEYYVGRGVVARVFWKSERDWLGSKINTKEKIVGGVLPNVLNNVGYIICSQAINHLLVSAP